MKTIALFVAFVSFLPAAAADVSIADNQKTVTVDCAKDPNLSIAGNHVTATLTGTCTKITITGNHASVAGSATTVSIMGNHNTVALDAVDDLSVLGNHNTATYKTTVDPKKKTTKVSRLGNKNKITRTK